VDADSGRSLSVAPAPAPGGFVEEPLRRQGHIPTFPCAVERGVVMMAVSRGHDRTPYTLPRPTGHFA
jgi:hypothetical protein